MFIFIHRNNGSRSFTMTTTSQRSSQKLSSTKLTSAVAASSSSSSIKSMTISPKKWALKKIRKSILAFSRRSKSQNLPVQITSFSSSSSSSVVSSSSSSSPSVSLEYEAVVSLEKSSSFPEFAFGDAAPSPTACKAPPSSSSSSSSLSSASSSSKASAFNNSSSKSSRSLKSSFSSSSTSSSCRTSNVLNDDPRGLRGKEHFTLASSPFVPTIRSCTHLLNSTK
uniref:Cell wall integrity and stress response component 1 n=1 Tax=Romanomermis culicivorax TaxID=13658 RepID=A0A915L0Q5_ROMCU